MSNTIAHRAHIHIPWTTIAIVLVAALAAAGVLVLVNQPADVTVETTPVVLTAPGAAAMPQIETHTEILSLTGRAPGVDAKAAVYDTRHNFPIGVSLDSSGTDIVPTIVPDTRHNFPSGTSLD
jgi:hypothetical protein